jgi:hypothetical protein
VSEKNKTSSETANENAIRIATAFNAALTTLFPPFLKVLNSRKKNIFRITERTEYKEK